MPRESIILSITGYRKRIGNVGLAMLEAVAKAQAKAA